MHSTTREKPIESFFGRRVNSDPLLLKKHRQETANKLKEKQITDLAYHNRKKRTLKQYAQGEVIFVKINKRLGNKLTSRYKKEIVSENYNTTVKTQSGRIVHTNNIKQSRIFCFIFFITLRKISTK